MELVKTFGGPSVLGDKWDLRNLEINYGIFVDPIDQNNDFVLKWGDPRGPAPEVDEIEDVTEWNRQLNYRVGTFDAMQTVFHDDIEFLEEQVKTYEISAGSKEVLQLWVSSSLAGASIVCSGRLDFIETIIQRQVADDHSEFEADFVFEDTLDEEVHQNANAGQ